MVAESQALRPDSIDPQAFDYLDHLDCLPALAGRVFLNRAAKAQANQPALLFVHGGYMGAWAFTAYLRYFDQLGLPSAAIDCRGHGGLTQSPDFISAGVEDFANDVSAACSQFSVPPVLLGHSLGALTATVAMGMCDIAGLGLLAPSPPGQLPGARTLPLLSEDRLQQPPQRFRGSYEISYGSSYENLSIKTSHERIEARLCAESPVALNDRYGLRIKPASPRNLPTICIASACEDVQRHPPGQDFAVGDFFGAENYLLDKALHCFMLTPDWQDSADLIAQWYQREFNLAF